MTQCLLLSYLGWLVLEGKNGRFIASLMVLQILVFYPNVPAAVNFAETSNSCSMISVWFYNCMRCGSWVQHAYSILPATGSDTGS